MNIFQTQLNWKLSGKATIYIGIPIAAQLMDLLGLHQSHTEFVRLLKQTQEDSVVPPSDLASLMQEMGAITWGLQAAEVYQAKALALLETLQLGNSEPLRCYITRDFEKYEQAAIS